MVNHEKNWEIITLIKKIAPPPPFFDVVLTPCNRFFAFLKSMK